MRSVRWNVTALAFALVALAVSGVASASAAQWNSNGKALTGSAEISQTTKVEEAVEVSFYFEEKKEETFTCTTVTGYASRPFEITAPSTLKIGDLLLKGCKMTYPSTCKVSGGEIGTEPLVSTMSLGAKSPEVGGELVPEVGKYWTEFEATGCIDEGAYRITGKLPIKMPAGQTESAEQEIVFQKAAGLYNFGNTSEPIYITGKVKLKLTSGQKWSYH